MPVTQLYVSVDAATPETLKAVDRPLFSDFWERFTGSLSSLRAKAQRTVYRRVPVAPPLAQVAAAAPAAAAALLFLPAAQPLWCLSGASLVLRPTCDTPKTLSHPPNTNPPPAG